MIARLHHIASVALLCLPASLAAAGSTTFVALNPAGTYLRTNSDPAPGAVPLDLAALGIAEGDRISLQRLGEWDNGPGGDTFTTLIAVFSAGNVLLPSDQPHRVPGAIAAGIPVITGPSHFGAVATDIPEDFVIAWPTYPNGEVCVIVPKGATHLFTSVGDSLFYDNVDPDRDWGLQIAVLDACAADLDADGVVGASDLGILLGSWGPSSVIGAPGDLDCDADVDAADLATLLGLWGGC
jgi:hypothetical protein